MNKLMKNSTQYKTLTHILGAYDLQLKIYQNNKH